MAAVYISVFIFGVALGRLIPRSLGKETLCNATVFETTRHLVYCVQKGIHYDKTRRPNSPSLKDGPVIVNVSIDIASLNVDADDMAFSLELFFKQSWHDPNLAYAEDQTREKKFIVFKADLLKDLWTPDTYIYGIKSMQTVQTENALPTSEGLRISPGGRILFATRLSMKLRCSMNFRNFPMDKQTCYLNLTSFFHTADDLSYEWKDVTIQDKNIAHFELISFQNRKTIEEFATGKYDRLTMTFEFKRRINFYLLSWYLPATLIVVLSWVGFWIDIKSTPARISLGTITILAIGSFLIGEQEGFPSVSYVRAIDIYLIACFVFVFGCMVEYAIVHCAKRLEEEREQQKKKGNKVEDTIPCESDRNNGKTVGNGLGGILNAGFVEVISPVSTNNVLPWNDNRSSRPTITEDASESKKSISLFSYCNNRFQRKVIFNWLLKLDEICRLIFPLTFLVLAISYYITFGDF